MQKEKKLTEEDFNYYMSGCEGLKFTGDDADNVDNDAIDAIPKLAQSDVIAGEKKKERSYFKNEAEYKLYLLSVYDVATCIKAGLM